jgi:hypothetical protein
MTNECFYFGCWDEVGHHLWSNTRRTMHERSLPRDFPVRIDILDGGLLGYFPETEGVAVVVHVGNWTIVSFWDRSVDERGKSNSSFVMRGKLNLDDALLVAQDKFPSIFTRFRFEIKERQ